MASSLHFAQNAFTQGEITPRLGLRQADLTKFRDACETMTNWIALPHGGMRTRPTTRYVGEIKTMSLAGRLLPFVFNTAQTYAIELGNQFFRVWANVAGTPGQILDGGSPEEVVTPYLTAELAAIDYAQDADVLYLTHPNWQPRKIERLTASTFQISTVSFTGGPFCSLTHPLYSGIGTGTTMNPSVTAKDATGIVTASSDFFTTDMVGMKMRIHETTGTPAEQGYVTLDTFNSTTEMAITVNSTLSASSATDDWSLGAWGEETGWPEHISFFQQRLCFANTAAEPDTVWMSTTAGPEDFTVGTDDDDAVNVRVVSSEVNEIVWISGSRTSLLIGTAGNEYSVTGGNDLAVTPTNILAVEDTNYGSDAVKPIKVPKGVVYVENGGRKLNHITYSLEDDSFGSTDITLFAEHITANNPVRELAYQKRRDAIIWARLNDGTMMGITWLPEQKVVSAHKHTWTNGTIESFIVLPANDAQDDELWCIMNRTVNGATVRYVEMFDETYGLDSALKATGPGRTFTGLDHLEGETVQIIGDGATYNDQTVASGSITINDDEIEITAAEVGLHTSSTAITVQPYIELRDGVSFGRKMAWGELNVDALDTLTINIDGERMLTRTVDDLMHSVPDTPEKATFTTHGTDPENKGRVTIANVNGLKSHILGIYGKVSIGD